MEKRTGISKYRSERRTFGEVEELRHVEMSLTKTGGTARVIQGKIMVSYATMNRLTNVWKEIHYT